MIHLIYITLLIITFIAGAVVTYLRFKEILGEDAIQHITRRYYLGNILLEYWDSEAEELTLDVEKLLDETPDVVDFLHTLIITRNGEEVKFKGVYKGNEYEFIGTNTSDTI